MHRFQAPLSTGAVSSSIQAEPASSGESGACAAQSRDTFQSCRNKACGNPLPKKRVTKLNTRKDTACLQGRGQRQEIRQTSRNKAASAQCRLQTSESPGAASLRNKLSARADR